MKSKGHLRSWRNLGPILGWYFSIIPSNRCIISRFSSVLQYMPFSDTFNCSPLLLVSLYHFFLGWLFSLCFAHDYLPFVSFCQRAGRPEILLIYIKGILKCLFLMVKLPHISSFSFCVSEKQMLKAEYVCYMCWCNLYEKGANIL